MGEISPQLADNEAWVDQTFEKCDDILHRLVYLGRTVIRIPAKDIQDLE